MDSTEFLNEIRRDARKQRLEVLDRSTEAERLINEYLADNPEDASFTKELRREQARMLVELRQKVNGATYKELLSTFEAVSSLVARYDKKEEGPVAPQVTQFFFAGNAPQLQSPAPITDELTRTDVLDI